MGSTRLVASGRSKILSAQIASPYEANSTLYRVQRRLSREGKAKALLCANSVVDSASLLLTTLSIKKVLRREVRIKALSAKDLSREAKNEAPLSANNEAISASLKGRALRSRVKPAFKDKAKIVASRCETTLSAKAILASPIAKKKAFKAKPRFLNPKRLTSSFPESLC